MVRALDSREHVAPGEAVEGVAPVELHHDAAGVSSERSAKRVPDALAPAADVDSQLQRREGGAGARAGGHGAEAGEAQPDLADSDWAEACSVRPLEADEAAVQQLG